MSHEEHPIVDPAAAERLRDIGGDRLLKEMIRLYLENAAVRLDQIHRGLAADGDLQQAFAGAHSLKSSAANVGALRVSALARALEAEARGGDADAARVQLAPLEEALSQAAAQLSALALELP